MIVEEITTTSQDETIALGERFAKRLNQGDCVALTGQLGSGKTVFVRGLARGLNVADDRIVCSPTFVLVRQYDGKIRLYHIDLYRLNDAPAEIEHLGLEEMLDDGIVVIEWADKADDALPRPYWQIEIIPTGLTTRKFIVKRIE